MSKSKSVGCRLDDETAQEFDSEAQRLGVLPSMLLKKIITQYLNESKSTSPIESEIDPDRHTLRLTGYLVDSSGDYFTPGIYPAKTLSSSAVQIAKKRGILQVLK